MSKFITNGEYKKCLSCNRLFYLKKGRIDSDYCSKACQTKSIIDVKGLNKLELLGKSILDELDIIYSEQVLIENKYIVDVLIPENMIVIEWDGDYWHCSDKFDQPNQTQWKRKFRDEKKNEYLEDLGYKVLRFWESDVINNPKHVRKQIEDAMSSLSK